MIDVHAHFAEEGYPEEEWEKIRAAGVGTVILAADTLPHAKAHRLLAEKEEGCYFTVGIHPEFAEVALDEGIMSEMRALASHPKCVAVGEIGLDYHYGDGAKRKQRELFCRQLELAAEVGLPVEIHSRDACADTLAVLREARGLIGGRFLMHCYSYGAENLPAFSELGAYFSFGGVVCFKNARCAVEAAAVCPSFRLLTETDSPYLSPFRGEKNTPANIPAIVARLAEIRGTDAEEIVRTVRENAARLFPKLSI